MARIRKAIMAGVGAGASAVLAALPSLLEHGVSAEVVAKAAGVFVGPALLIGWATWRVRNSAV